jgi:hypothetical protein
MRATFLSDSESDQAKETAKARVADIEKQLETLGEVPTRKQIEDCIDLWAAKHHLTHGKNPGWFFEYNFGRMHLEIIA